MRDGLNRTFQDPSGIGVHGACELPGPAGYLGLGAVACSACV